MYPLWTRQEPVIARYAAVYWTACGPLFSGSEVFEKIEVFEVLQNLNNLKNLNFLTMQFDTFSYGIFHAKYAVNHPFAQTWRAIYLMTLIPLQGLEHDEFVMALSSQ